MTIKKRIRIAIAIDENGKWNSCGWDSTAADHEKEMQSIALDGELNGAVAQYWIEVDVPLPEIQTLQGEVTQ